MHVMGMIKTGHGKQAVKKCCGSPDGWVHLLGQLVSALLVHSWGLKRQGTYTPMREDALVFQELHGGRPYHMSEINAFVRRKVAHLSRIEGSLGAEYVCAVFKALP